MSPMRSAYRVKDSEICSISSSLFTLILTPCKMETVTLGDEHLRATRILKHWKVKQLRCPSDQLRLSQLRDDLTKELMIAR